ncbi:MAG: TetR/AcrR family transcriptional regulator [Polyangiales bacterium]
MPRLSRAESQARTREKLLATAKTCFLRDGFAATSLEGIAEAAGYSKGAVYSNFESKDELCLAVIDGIRTERAVALTEAVAGLETLEERIGALESWAERNIGDRAWTSLEVEFAVHASRNKALGRELAKREKSIRSIVVGLVGAQTEALGLELPMPAEDVAIALLSLGIGLGVQRAIDPTLSVRSLGKLARLFAAKRTSKSKR